MTQKRFSSNYMGVVNFLKHNLPNSHVQQCFWVQQVLFKTIRCLSNKIFHYVKERIVIGILYHISKRQSTKLK